jgi:branched-chain amino acid transport system permease protein
MSSLAARRFRLTTKQAPAIVGGLLVVGWLVVLFTHSDQLQPTVFGIASGALIAAIALGATLTYRGSGVVNFSVAAMAMYASFIFYDLYANGSLFFPPPIPSWQLVHVTASNGVNVPPFPIWLVFLLTMVECAVLGLLFHLLVFRPLRKSPALAKVAASIGLFLVLFSTVTVRFPSSEGYSFPSILPQGTWYLGGVAIPINQAMLVFIVIGVAAILWAVFKFTRFGIATRAAAENERGAVILGYNPDRLAAINWVVSTMLVGAFGLLFASINSTIDALSITLLIVPALAAALVGRFSSFPVTVITALVLGSSEAWLLAVSNDGWFPGIFKYQGAPLQGLTVLLPFLVIVAVLFFRGERLPSRGSEATLRMPRAALPRHPLRNGAILFVLVVASAFLLNSDWRIALEISVVAAIMCASLTVLTGFVGQISLMQMTLGGVAGFVLAKFCDAHGIPFPFGPIIAAAAATVVGLIAAVPALRIRGVNLAVVTLAAAVVIESFVYNLPAFEVGITTGSQANVKPPSLLGWAFGPYSPWKKIFGHPSGSVPSPYFTVFCMLVLMAVLGTVLWIRRSNLGRRMLAVRSNERAAAAAGVSVPMTKMAAFAIAAFIAGIGGVLFSYSFEGVDTTFFSSINSLILIAVAYLGGISMVEGSPISGTLFQAGLFATFLSAIVHVNPEYAVYIAGIGLIFASINNPEGIAGSIRDARERVQRRRGRSAPDPDVAPVPEPAQPIGAAS